MKRRRRERYPGDNAPPPGLGGVVCGEIVHLYSSSFLAGEWQPPCYDIHPDGSWKRTDPTEDWIEVRADGWFRKRPEKNPDDLRPKPTRRP